MEGIIIGQDYDRYLAQDHKTWSTLVQRHKALPNDKISKEYLKGHRHLELDDQKITRISELSDKLQSISGWCLIPVSGLIPVREFLYMLCNKQYPVTTAIRTPAEVDFAELPDIFHDVYGHLPLLANKDFTRLLTTYGELGIKYIDSERAIDCLGRLYWFTYEMGLIWEDGETKAYGGALITSREELANAMSSGVPKHPFDLDLVFATSYNHLQLQKEYFVIESFEALFESIEGLEEKLADHLAVKV